MCVCVCERERERERGGKDGGKEREIIFHFLWLRIFSNLVPTPSAVEFAV